MAVLNSMLNIMPWSCRYCVQGHKALLHVSEQARHNGINLIELEGPEAVKQPVWDNLVSMDPIFVNGFGHGNEGIFTGDTEQAIFTTAECSILANRVVYLLSCLTAVRLGPEIINIGGIAYIGYDISWTWMTEDVNADPYDLRIAEGFYRSANEFPIALLQGASVEVAKERCIAEYNRWIEIWETDRAGDSSAASVIMWLLFDRDGLTVLGDQNATIVATGVPTTIVVDIEPPQNVHPGESFWFQGKLLERETGNPLIGKTVKLCQVGLEQPIATTITDSEGIWTFDTLLTGGVHTIYAFSPGDDDHAPSYSPTFRVEVGLTLMEVTTFPQSSVEVGGTITFSGTLIDKSTMLGLSEKTIQLVGVDNLTAVTDENGNWSFTIPFSTEGRHKLYAEFLGDSIFAGSKTDEYRVSVGVLPIVGYDEVDIPYSFKSAAYSIIGTTFKTKEAGIAKGIVVFIYRTYSADAKMKCAIYKRSDMSLVGVTEERVFLRADGSFKRWVSFVMINSPKLEADTEYVFVGWSSNAAFMIYTETSDDKQGIEPRSLTYTGIFPDPNTSVRYWADKKHSIYCEYIKEEETMDVTFAGIVSAQATAVEEVTITVTLPNGSTEQVIALTGEDKSFSVGYSNEPGSYSAKARVEEDALYLAAESDDVPFAIPEPGKLPRTITLTVA